MLQISQINPQQPSPISSKQNTPTKHPTTTITLHCIIKNIT